MSWELKFYMNKEKFRNPFLLAGLPGIANVGKIAVDFLKNELKAKKVLEFSSCELPHTVFVNEKNLIELPSIQIYCASLADRDMLLLVGDAQPINESACYDFCKTVIEVLNELNCNEVITLGGIALRHVPKKPQVYCIGTNKKVITDFSKSMQLKTDLYGIVGPIIGVTGVLAGLASKNGLNSVILLAETCGHPMFLGIAGAKELLNVLCKKFGINVKLDFLSRELKQFEEDLMLQSQEFADAATGAMTKLHNKRGKEVSYIG